MEKRTVSPTEQLKFLTWVMGGLFGLALVSLLTTRVGGWVGAVSCGLAIMLAAIMIGSLLGFLFSVPRVLAQSDGKAPPRGDPAGGDPGDNGSDGSDPGRRLLQTNTNLERISDWLTTMLVGVGLSQISSINGALYAFRKYIATYPDGGGLSVISPLLLLFGLVAGFLSMYLYTRIILSSIFNGIEGLLGGTLSRRAQAVVTLAAREAQASGVSTVAIDDIAHTRAEVTPGDTVQVMFDLLYQPEGYSRVIAIGEKLAGTDAANKAIFWFYLAAAYGQAMTDAREREDSRTAAQMRGRALDAADRAVRIDASYRNRLWYLSDPESSDNDLSALRGDPEFRRIVRR